MLAQLGRRHGLIMERALRACRSQPAVTALLVGLPLVADRFDPLDLIVIIDQHEDEADDDGLGARSPHSESLGSRCQRAVGAVADRLGPPLWREPIIVHSLRRDFAPVFGQRVVSAGGVLTEVRATVLAGVEQPAIVAWARRGSKVALAPVVPRWSAPERVRSVFVDLLHFLGDTPKLVARPNAHELAMETLRGLRLIVTEFLGLESGVVTGLPDAIDAKRLAHRVWLTVAPHRLLNPGALDRLRQLRPVHPDDVNANILDAAAMALVSGRSILAEAGAAEPTDAMAAVARYLERHLGPAAETINAALDTPSYQQESTDGAATALNDGWAQEIPVWLDATGADAASLTLPDTLRRPLSELLGWARGDHRIVGVGLGGSLMAGRADAYSDLDVHVVVADELLESFRKTFAEPLTASVRHVMTARGGPDFVRMVTPDWSTIEVMVRPEHATNMWTSMDMRLLDLGRQSGAWASRSTLVPLPAVTSTEKRRELARRLRDRCLVALAEIAAVTGRGDEIGAVELAWDLRAIAIDGRDIVYRSNVGSFTSGRPEPVPDALIDTMVIPGAGANAIDHVAALAGRVRDSVVDVCLRFDVDWPTDYEHVLADRLRREAGRMARSVPS